MTAFVLLTTLSLVGVVIWDGWQEHKKKLKETEITTSNMTRALAQHAGDTIQSVDNIVVGLVNSVENTNAHGINVGELNPFLSQRVAELQILQALSVVDHDGKLLASSESELSKNYTYADRNYFQHHRASGDPGPYIGPAIRSKTTNEPILTVSRRLDNDDGSFAGVAVATLRLEYFRFFYEEFDVGYTGVILLASDNGMLLVRQPYIEAAVGSSIAGGGLLNEYRTKGSVGTAMLTSMVDQTVRLYSYRGLEQYPLLVAVGLGKHEILASWRQETIRLAAICGLLLILLAGSGSYLIIQTNLRQNSEEELSKAKQDLESLNAELQMLASEDSLMGIANRRTFDITLKQEFIRAVRNRSSLALVMIDVDRFKQFNDIYGHLAGDDCLRKLGQALKQIPSRSSDLVARYGGEELVVLLPETDIDGAEQMAERVRQTIEALAIPHSANPGQVVTVSAGVAAIKPTLGDNDALGLLQAADDGLYRAKDEGRNRVIRAAMQEA